MSQIDEKALQAAHNAMLMLCVDNEECALSALRKGLEAYEAARAPVADIIQTEPMPEAVLNYSTSGNDQPVRLLGDFNSHNDKLLTKSGGMGFTVWSYILVLENKAHGNPTGKTSPIDWWDYYENDHTPHSAIEGDFNYAG